VLLTQTVAFFSFMFNIVGWVAGRASDL